MIERGWRPAVRAGDHLIVGSLKRCRSVSSGAWHVVQ
jgi:hypothetical protein